MSGVTIGWDESDPADSKNLGLGAGDIRSTKTNLRGALDAEHLWPSAGGYSGIHRPGSAVAFYGTASQVSSADTDGRIMLTSNTSRLFSVGNSQTSFLLGGRYVVLARGIFNNEGSAVNSGVTQFQQIEQGRAQINSGSATTAVTLGATYVSTSAVAFLMPAGSVNTLAAYTASVAGNVLTINRWDPSTRTAENAPANDDVFYLVSGTAAL